MKRHYANPVAQRAYELIASAAGIVVVHFVKRTDGTLRRMMCLFNEAAVEAARLRYNPIDKNLLLVWDVEAGEPRNVSLDGVLYVTIAGQRHDLEPVRTQYRAEIADARALLLS